MATEFVSVLPPNAFAEERALEQAGTEPVRDVPLLIKHVKRVDDCPAHLLPWLAWEYRVDTWNTDWTDEEKRAAIRRAPFIHRHRGTPGAVLRALENAPFETRLVEWFEQVPRGEPYTFLMQALQAGKPVTEQHMQDMKAAVLRTKNLRSWFRMQILGEREGELILAGWMRATEQTVFGSAVRCYAVQVNGRQTQCFEPVTGFAGATYRLLTHGGTGPLRWTVVHGQASITQAGEVTVQGPGRVRVSATDPAGNTMHHTIAPRLWFTPGDVPGTRLPVPAELKVPEHRHRQDGALWNEWGDMTAYGWPGQAVITAVQDGSTVTVVSLTGPDAPAVTQISLNDISRYARVGVTDHYRSLP
ncbi:phage tail protein I [Enterobacter roggenkampii]|uniref:phage tail protein I n=1 Tax=Enterobacter roggenkampii TaxID=1812935 RepID=UPI0022384B7C|nr:phage tail protein I [Enterobacter roggenkampii]MCW5003537.1 phage tail protein I [Enterobacter roggenkampii]